MIDDLNKLQDRLRSTHVLINLEAQVGGSALPHKRKLLVKKTLSVRELIDEIAREVLRDSNEKREDYKLFQNDQLLPPRERVEKLRQPAVLTYRRQRGDVSFIESASQIRHEVTELPAILGRFAEGEQREDYTVNLGAARELGNTISRKHARLKFEQGQYYIQNISNGNFLYVNGERVEEGSTHIIKPGDKVRLGEVKFVFEQTRR